MSLYATCRCGIPEGSNEAHLRTDCPLFGVEAGPTPMTEPTQAARDAADEIEALAQFLHDEGGFSDAWTAHTWPEHPGDEGRRDGGWVKIVPSDVQAQFRDAATRLYHGFILARTATDNADSRGGDALGQRENDKPPSHWSPDERYADRQPMTPEEWDWRADSHDNDPLDRSIKRINYAADRADPHAPDQMATVLRIDLMRLTAQVTWLTAKCAMQNEKIAAIATQQGNPAASEGLIGLEWTEDGYSLRTPCDGDVDGDGRHIIVGGEIVVTFADSDEGEKAREAFSAALAHSGDTAKGDERVRAISDIADERRRQVKAEGWTLEHDDEHGDGSLAAAAATYAFSAATADRFLATDPIGFWPWDAASWKPTTPRRDLVKAGALIVAEIERIDRAALSQAGEGK